MTIEEVKALIASARSIEREVKRMREEIEELRQTLLSVKSSLRASTPVLTSESLSMPERVYFRLEELYNQYSAMLQKQYDKTAEIEEAIAQLDPLEQEIVRAVIAGKTEEQIGAQVGYSDRTVRNYKKRILIKLSEIKSLPPIS